MNKRFLVVARVGDKSLHPSWLEGEAPIFDLFLSYFGDQAEKYVEQAQFYEQQKGGKWPKIGELVEKNWAIISTYDAVWFPDDDLLTSSTTINRMFRLFDGHQLALAQPALDISSYYTFPALLQKTNTLLRFCNFVEVMAPIMCRTTLSKLKHTFQESPSGWGLDSLWPKLIDNSHYDKCAIIDAVAVVHTRPVGGELYKKNPELSPSKDIEKLEQLYADLNIQRRAFNNRFRIYRQFKLQGNNNPTLAFIRGKLQKIASQFKALFSSRYRPS
jgi:hypothetical protein